MSDLLEVTARSVTGTNACQKLRHEGHVPAVLYGHGESCVDLVVERDAVEAMVRHCLLYTSPSPRDGLLSRMPSSA